MNGSKLFSGLKFTNYILLCDVFQNSSCIVIFYVLNFKNLKFPLRELVLAESIYGCKKLFINVDHYYPGCFLNSSFCFLDDLRLGQMCDMFSIPYGGVVCQIYNVFTTRIVYIKSSGAKAIKDRDKNKGKLIGLMMPSGILKFFSLNVICYYSSVINLYLN
jgi:hypothetical protein